MDADRSYLVVIELADTKVDRLKMLAPSLIDVLNSLSNTPSEQAFRSVNADLFGYFVKTKLVSRQISAAIQSPNPKLNITPFLTNEDGIFVLELGDDFLAGKGFTRAATWLQHH